MRYQNQADTSVLESLKVGDTALVQEFPTRYGGGSLAIYEREVVKVTPTQIHVQVNDSYAQTFDRRTGLSRGDSQRSSIVDPIHPDTLKTLERTRTVQARNRLDHAIEAYRRNSFDGAAVRGVITAATHLAGRLDMML